MIGMPSGGAACPVGLLKRPSAKQRIREGLDDTKQVCACALVGNDLLVALNKSCTPMTPETLTSVMNSNPMFAAMMAINSIGGTDFYQVYRDAAIDTCGAMNGQLA